MLTDLCLNYCTKTDGGSAIRLPSSQCNYWEGVVVPMQNSPWWLHPRPREALDGRIWDNRAALMDSIYYDPSTKRMATGLFYPSSETIYRSFYI